MAFWWWWGAAVKTAAAPTPPPVVYRQLAFQPCSTCCRPCPSVFLDDVDPPARYNLVFSGFSGENACMNDIYGCVARIPYQCNRWMCYFIHPTNENSYPQFVMYVTKSVEGEYTVTVLVEGFATFTVNLGATKIDSEEPITGFTRTVGDEGELVSATPEDCSCAIDECTACECNQRPRYLAVTFGGSANPDHLPYPQYSPFPACGDCDGTCSDLTGTYIVDSFMYNGAVGLEPAIPCRWEYSDAPNDPEHCCIALRLTVLLKWVTTEGYTGYVIQIVPLHGSQPLGIMLEAQVGTSRLDCFTGLTVSSFSASWLPGYGEHYSPCLATATMENI
jgi:hypothetical protein